MTLCYTDPAAKAAHLTARHLSIAVTRLYALVWANLFRVRGLPLSQFYRASRTSPPTVWRWQKNFERAGFAALMPRTDRCGRKPKQNKTKRTE